MYEKLSQLDGWLRNRIRHCIWHHWNLAKRSHDRREKQPERKRKNLIRLGVEHNQAYA